MSHPNNTITLAQAVIREEGRAIEALLARIDDHFVQACETILTVQGRVVVIGMENLAISATRLPPLWRAPVPPPSLSTRARRAMGI